MKKEKENEILKGSMYIHWNWSLINICLFIDAWSDQVGKGVTALSYFCTIIC